MLSDVLISTFSHPVSTVKTEELLLQIRQVSMQCSWMGSTPSCLKRPCNSQALGSCQGDLSPRSFQAVPLTAAPAAHGFSLALDADRPLPQQGTAPETQPTRRARLLHTEVHAVTGGRSKTESLLPRAADLTCATTRRATTQKCTAEELQRDCMLLFS